MILKGNQRGGAAQLAVHLLKDENEHVDIHEMRGFVSDDLQGAFGEAHAIAKGTKCQQFLFSLSLNPPQHEAVSTKAFERAADEAEKRLGLEGQPRAIVFHEKEGRRHAHVVWSRIDANSMTAINLSHYKRKLTSLSKEIYLEHGWKLPGGLRDPSLRDPLNFDREEWQQALRVGRDPREIKQLFQESWQQSDSPKAFNAALNEYGFTLARGDRRGYVALDYTGEVYAVAKYTSLRTKQVKDKLGDPVKLPSVDEAKQALKNKLTPRLKELSDTQRKKQTEELVPLTERKQEMAKIHARERLCLNTGQEKHWQAETKIRQDRLHSGLKGIWDWMSGHAHKTRDLNRLEAWESLKRDQFQKDRLILDQLTERRSLQTQIATQKQNQLLDRRKLDRNIGLALKMDGHKERVQDRAMQIQQQFSQQRKRSGPELGR